MRDGDVFKRDVELRRAFEEVGADAVGDGLSLGDELGGIKLCDDGLEDFVANRGQDTLVIVLSEVLHEELVANPTHMGSTIQRDIPDISSATVQPPADAALLASS